MPNMNPMFNPMGRCGGMKSPEQMQQEMAQMMNQYNEMYQRMSGWSPNSPNQVIDDTFAKRRRGEYAEVHDPSEVEKASVPMDGTPRLFFDFKNGRFWAKKYENGQNYVTPYSFSSLMQTTADAAVAPSEPAVDYTKELATQNEPEKNTDDERLDRLEAMMAQMYERVMRDEPDGSSQSRERNKQSTASPRNGVKRPGKEVTGDGGDVVGDDQARG